MPTPFSGDLADDLCYLICLGPSFGETVLIRVPPETWIVVDSLQSAATPAAIAASSVLSGRKARTACVALTHPHKDHAQGFASLIDAQPKTGIVGCGEIFVDPPATWNRSPDAERVLRSGEAEHALAAIRSRWDAEPTSRWDLIAGSHRDIGEARLEALFPDLATLHEFKGKTFPKRNTLDFNKLSSPMLLEWKDLRVVLGADLPATKWKKVEQPDPPLSQHHGLKVPHHGSAEALLKKGLCAGERDRYWVVTPWKIGGFLPDFDDGKGVEDMLRYVDLVHLTAAPFDLVRPPSWPDVTRSEISAARDRVRFNELLLYYSSPTRDFDETWVMVGFGATGDVVEFERGMSALAIST